jgi:hypothetical protein
LLASISREKTGNSRNIFCPNHAPCASFFYSLT